MKHLLEPMHCRKRKRITGHSCLMTSCFFQPLVWLVLLSSCNRNAFKYDATGTFEATEIMVSSEAAGKVEVFEVKEGSRLSEGQQVGYIDSTQWYLKKMQL